MISSAVLLDHASLSFQQGDYAQAEAGARQLVIQDPHFADGWQLLGTLHHVKGSTAEAMDCYLTSLGLQPNHADALNNLSILYISLNRHGDALDLLEAYLSRVPLDMNAHFNLANALASLNRYEEAADRYRMVLAAQPNHLQAIINYGALLVRQDRCEEALPYLRMAFEREPHSTNVHNHLGLAYLRTHQMDLAERHLRQGLHLDPQNYEIWTNLGNLAERVFKPTVALDCFRRAHDLRPEAPFAAANLGGAYLRLGKREEALECFRLALEFYPNPAAAQSNLGKALADLCRFREAEHALLQAIRHNPEFSEAHNLLGLVYFHLGEDISAERHLDEAIRLDPQHPHARLNRAFLWLRQGQFERAWPDYHCRPFAGMPVEVRCVAPLWHGEDLAGRTILIRAEQGLGDTLQFLRYLPCVQARGGRVVCEVPAQLLLLAGRCQGIDYLIAPTDPLPPVDVQIPLMSLPSILRSIESPTPYLSADPNLVESWRQKLEGIEGFKVGIAWQGDPSFPNDRVRSIPLAAFEFLAQVPGVRLISLQKHVGREQIDRNRERVPLIDFEPIMDEGAGAFMDTAAIIMNLDLVITSDTSIVHLAGALGRPVWMAVHHAPDWRWFLHREDSPWYPSLRLFRQTRLGDWDDVFARLAAALRATLTPPALPPLFVPTSPGELLDKISILHIKAERLANPAQIENVRAELRMLEQFRDLLFAATPPLHQYAGQLKRVNEALWQVEEDLRSCEKTSDFGPRFIELARSVYKHNDRRAALKRKINVSLGSALIEEKTHILADET